MQGDFMKAVHHHFYTNSIDRIRGRKSEQAGLWKKIFLLNRKRSAHEGVRLMHANRAMPCVRCVTTCI
jgi:hypothetical protein